jgi:hypothetical protein
MDGVTSTALQPIEGRNVSLGGICIQVEKRMKINEPVDLVCFLDFVKNNNQ